MSKVDVSVIVPTKNEEISITQFLEWTYEGFRRVGVTGEIILMDSSTDETPRIASVLGAKVISVEDPGLGNAYRKAKSHINGKWVIMGDADCTYDFRDIGPFLQKLEDGFDLVVGNRFRGQIEKNAMPKHHQYFGSPITSYFFSMSLGIKTRDIHCGMRALSRDLYLKLPFLESGWEYASEMIISAKNLGASISEIPIRFLKEPKGRISHQVRNGWLTPFRAGWGTLRVTATYAIDRFLLIPAGALFILGLFFNIWQMLMPSETAAEIGLGNVSTVLFGIFSITGVFITSLCYASRLLYKRNYKLLDFLSRTSFVEKTFSALVIISIIELINIISLLQYWNDGEFRVLDLGHNQVQRLAIFNLTTIAWVISLNLSILSFISDYLKKVRLLSEKYEPYI